MSLLNWSDTYSVRIREIDDQHQKWFGFINDLHDAMREGKGKEIVGKTLQAVKNYTVTHFSHEEGLMKLHNYPGYLQHKAIHDEFVKEIEAVYAKFQSGNTMVTLEVMNKLKDWLINHIQRMDMSYAPYLNDRGVK